MEETPSSSAPWWAMTSAVYPDMNRRLRCGAEGQQVFGQVSAVHLGHDHVGHEQVDLADIFPGQSDGFTRCAYRQHGVTLPFE